MGRLSGKKALVFGVANDKSIAWGIARALHREGAQLAFTFAGEALEKRVRPLAESVGSSIVLPCDVSRDEDIEKVYQEIQKTWGNFDYLVHSVAFAKKEELSGFFYQTSREGFRIALEVSAYSLVAVTRGAVSLMNPGGSIVTLTYYGSEKVVPNYNVMGVAKAALEACVRYLAYDLGPKNIRVNAVSAGPIKTLAASGVGKFKSMLKVAGEMTPLKRNVTQEEVGEAALFLLSDAASAITGEVLYVDAGANIVAMNLDENEKSSATPS